MEKRTGMGLNGSRDGVLGRGGYGRFSIFLVLLLRYDQDLHLSL